MSSQSSGHSLPKALHLFQYGDTDLYALARKRNETRFGTKRTPAASWRFRGLLSVGDLGAHYVEAARLLSRTNVCVFRLGAAMVLVDSKSRDLPETLMPAGTSIPKHKPKKAIKASVAHG